MTRTPAETKRPRTPAATRLPRPPHDWCSVSLPLHVIPGCLIVLDGDHPAMSALLARVTRVNDARQVMSPAPLTVMRVPAAAAAAQSRSVIQPAIAAGTPVFVAGGVPDEVVAAGEPVADLVATVRSLPPYAVTEPNVLGSIGSGFTTTLTGAHDSDHLLHLFQALLDASLAGLPVQRRSR